MFVIRKMYGLRLLTGIEAGWFVVTSMTLLSCLNNDRQPISNDRQQIG